MKKKEYAVFGLGRFGGSLVKEFHKMGIDVLAVDKDPEKVNEISQFATYAVHANAIDESTLKQLGVRNLDHAFVSFGNDIEASILTALILKEMGIPQVWAKAQNDYHHRVLTKLEVDRVIHPERDMAKRIAHYTASEKMIDYIELSADHSIAEIVASKKLHNHSLLDLDIRAKYGCNIVGFKRGEQMIVSPSAEENILKDDVLIVIGHNNDIARFEQEGV